MLFTLLIGFHSTVYADFGFELDALPFATGGWYASAWQGYGKWRVRAVASHINIPEFSVKDGFDSAETDAYALIADRFFGSGAEYHRGFWAGAGLEYWHNGISRSGYRGQAAYNTVMFTFGAGYVWEITDTIYLNPWFAGHVQAAGDRNVEVSGRKYRPGSFLSEASMKLGWRF